MRLTPAILLIAIVAISASPKDRAAGICQGVGNVVETSSRTPEAFRHTYPPCLVAVYLPGDSRKAVIYGDNAGTPAPNPFPSRADGSWQFYAAAGKYDVRFSGAGSG